jgi:septal ring factor EnvC (AmiA/AmiB activator)
MRGTAFFIIACLACLLALFLPGHPAMAQDESAQLRREKARLLEMKAQEEKTAEELTEALRKEKLGRDRVNELQGLLKKQHSVIAAIDRRVSALAERLNETEKQVRELTEAHRKARGGLRQAAALAFEGYRADFSLPVWPSPSSAERERNLMSGYLGADLKDVERLSRARERKERERSGIERQVELSERKMALEQKMGERLLSRQEAERKRLSDIAKEKEAKQRELRALRAKIARMESLVARVERLAKEKERQRRRKAREEAARGEKPPPPPQTPRRFASLPGGMSAPLPGRVVTRFGRQHDPTFDVTIENRGVELEAESGAPVRAAGSGEVAFTGAVSGYGNVLILQHGAGLFSVYGKLNDFLVKTGQEVAKGEAVGKLPQSPSGKSVLYFELRAGGTAVDPASVISLSR